MMSIFAYFRGRGNLRSCSFVALLVVLTTIGCGGGYSSMNTTATTPPPTPTGTVPQFGHVVLIVEENISYSDVIGSSAAPYLNSLATQYGLATQYYANTHPSIGNYFMLTTGKMVTNDDSFTGTVTVDNIVRELLAAGKTWKSYAESRGDPVLYVQRHDPLSYFSDVTGSSTQMQNLVSFSQFSHDLSNNALPNFSFIVPNLLDDAHSAPLQAADAWLQLNISPLISNATFQNDGLLIIAFDEGAGTDTAHGGGHVAAVIVSPKAKRGFQSTTLYQHESTLRLILQGLGVSNLPGASSSAPPMGEFF
jgi:acid phosphatase